MTGSVCFFGYVSVPTATLDLALSAPIWSRRSPLAVRRSRGSLSLIAGADQVNGGVNALSHERSPRSLNVSGSRTRNTPWLPDVDRRTNCERGEVRGEMAPGAPSPLFRASITLRSF